MTKDLTLEIVLTQPTADVIYGIQEGSGKTYKTIQKQTGANRDIIFSISVTLKQDRTKYEQPDFRGKFVQGPVGNRFIYIDIGTYAGQADSAWSRRLKIPLTGITWSDIDSMSEKSTLKTIVPGTGKDGGPNCATVKPFDGWKLSKRE